MGAVGKTEGPKVLLSGMTAGWIRQCTYTGGRLGMFDFLMNRYKKPGENLSFVKKAFFASIAGSFGAVVGCPGEVALIRMAADGTLPLEQRRNYRNGAVAIWRIAKEEGPRVLWRGVVPNVVRGILLNAGQLGFYAQTKETLLKRKFLGGNATMLSFYTNCFLASLVAGFIGATMSLPADIAKTRTQTMVGAKYNNSFVALMVCVRKEGFFSMWKGFSAFWVRIGMHTTIAFMTLEQLKVWFIAGYRKQL
eukprot:NODE_380_length_1005_cov_655.611925_g295_i0.p1 GENE.NODE_380_length_1005_cov_655.611925_g295_i0~~NODE_380_length_1005_cov_655.611925_g295_i0.p1  ORF type:complete len:250 (-),score=44.94 NODE_380_length_1005_cov_655.611925_g295_i0:226-975(-)